MCKTLVEKVYFSSKHPMQLGSPVPSAFFHYLGHTGEDVFICTLNIKHLASFLISGVHFFFYGVLSKLESELSDRVIPFLFFSKKAGT